MNLGAVPETWMQIFAQPRQQRTRPRVGVRWEMVGFKSLDLCATHAVVLLRECSAGIDLMINLFDISASDFFLLCSLMVLYFDSLSKHFDSYLTRTCIRDTSGAASCILGRIYVCVSFVSFECIPEKH